MKTRRLALALLVVALVLALGASAATASAQNSYCSSYYTVKPGDNLFRIGYAHGVTVEALMRANGIYNPNLVYAGQSLCIPGNNPPPNPVPKPNCGFYYTVQWGDTLSVVAQRYGVTMYAIMQANNIANANFIYAGMILWIPCGSNNNSGGTSYAQWKGEYYNNGDLAGAPSLVRNDAQIAFNWGIGWPNSKINAQSYSVRWTRKLYFNQGTFRFTMKYGGGARLSVDNVQLVDAWQPMPGSSDTFVADVPLGTGYHTIIMEYHKLADVGYAYLSWARTTQPPMPGPVYPTPIPPVPPVGSAWTGYYYGNQYLDDLRFSRIDPSIDFNWGRSSPGGDVPRDLWSARWVSTQYFPTAGVYEFLAQVDDGVRIYVDNNLVVNDWFDHSGVSKGTVNLSAGPHSVKVEYYDFGREAMLTVWWVKK